MASIAAIQQNYRPTGSVYSPFGGTVPVDYTPNLTRRRTYYWRSIAAGPMPELRHADISGGGGIWSGQSVDVAAICHDPSAVWEWKGCPEWAFSDPTICILGIEHRPVMEGCQDKGTRYILVTWASNVRTGVILTEIPESERIEIHECHDGTCMVCRPSLRDVEQERAIVRKAQTRRNGIRKGKTPQRVFDGRTGEWRWI